MSNNYLNREQQFFQTFKMDNARLRHRILFINSYEMLKEEGKVEEHLRMVLHKPVLGKRKFSETDMYNLGSLHEMFNE